MCCNLQGILSLDLKNFIKIVLCVISFVSLSACSSQNENNNEEIKILENSSEEKKALVLYFSQSGNTETVAYYIRKKLMQIL